MIIVTPVAKISNDFSFHKEKEAKELLSTFKMVLDNEIGKIRRGEMIEVKTDNSGVLLTKYEAYTLAEHIELTIYSEIRGNPGMDDINWLVDMCSAYSKLKEFSGYQGVYDNFLQSGQEGGEE